MNEKVDETDKNQHPEPQCEDQPASLSDQKTQPNNLSELLDHFVESTEEQEKVKVDDLLQSLSSRSHGPMLLFPAILAISPLGMIPGMSVITGTLIILIGSQMLFFSSRPWIPKFVGNYSFSREKLTNGVNKSKPWMSGLKKQSQSVRVYGRRRHDLPSGVIVRVARVLFFPLSICAIRCFCSRICGCPVCSDLTAKEGPILISQRLSILIATATMAWRLLAVLMHWFMNE